MKYIKLILRLLFIFGVILIVLNQFAYSSVISKKAVGNKYLIDCLGTNNQLILYDLNNTKILNSKCDNTLWVYTPIIEQAKYLEILNSPDSDDRLDYKETLNQIATEQIISKMDIFTKKVCFTIESQKYIDIKILSDETKNVKTYYKCFDRSNIDEQDNSLTSNSNKVTLPIYINNQLYKEYTITKSKQPLSISFQDLSLITKKTEKNILVNIRNPSGETLKVNVIDSNVGCNKKNFVISDKYMLYCNISKNQKSYYIQLKTSDNRIFFKEYSKPPEKNSNSNTTLYIIIGVIGLIIAYNIYKKQAKSKDKTAIEQLQERQNEEIKN